jgi:hypothetical protein
MNFRTKNKCAEGKSQQIYRMFENQRKCIAENDEVIIDMDL